MVNRNKKSISDFVLLLTNGSIFTMLGIAIMGITIDGLIQYDISVIGVGIILPIILTLALLGFGITALVMGGKQITLRIRENKTYTQGKSATAQITGCKSASFSQKRNTRIRYALTLSYNDGEKDKIFTTDYLFDVNEFKYLNKLEKIKIKIDGNFVVVCETFPKDIYMLDSNYGVEIAFYKQKPVAVLLRLWAMFFFIALAFLIVSMVTENSTCIQIALIIIFAVHFPFAIPLAIYLIKWFNRKGE